MLVTIEGELFNGIDILKMCIFYNVMQLSISDIHVLG